MSEHQKRVDPISACRCNKKKELFTGLFIYMCYTDKYKYMYVVPSARRKEGETGEGERETIVEARTAAMT